MKLTLLTTTAIIALSMTSTAQATDSSWVDNLTQSVQTWFAGDEQASAEVETYLDEVTIAVPPMTGEEAAAIQPAAGDYQESLEEAIQNIPGSIQDDQSFNTEFSNDTGSIAAFEDGVSADDLANIMPAAGDADEMMDEAISSVVSDAQDEVVTETIETAVERIQPESLTTQVEGAAELIAAPTTETVTEMVKDAAEDKVAETVESATETIAVEAAETVADDAMTQAKDMAMDKAEEMVKDAIEPATGAMTDTAVDTMKGMLK